MFKLSIKRKDKLGKKQKRKKNKHKVKINNVDRVAATIKTEKNIVGNTLSLTNQILPHQDIFGPLPAISIPIQGPSFPWSQESAHVFYIHFLLVTMNNEP